MSPRTLDPTFATALADTSSTYAHLFEFYRRSTVTTGQQLVRITNGLVEDVQTSGLSDLSGFTELAGVGEWSLTGGKIRWTPNGSGHALLRYDGITSTNGIIVQVLADERSAGDAFWGAASIIDSGISSIDTYTYLIEKWVQRTGSAAPPGTEAQRTKIIAFDQTRARGVCGQVYDCTGAVGTAIHTTYATDGALHQDHPVSLAVNGPRTGGIEGYTHKSVNGPQGFGFLKSAPVLFDDDGCAGLWGRQLWEIDEANCPVVVCPDPTKSWMQGTIPWQYSGAIDFTRLSFHTGYDVKIIGLPDGWTGEITGGASPAYGADVGGTNATAGVSVIDPWGDMYPFTTIKLYAGSIPLNLTAQATPTDGIWGGDVWELQSTSTTVENFAFGITDASGDIEYNGHAFEAIGGEITWHGLGEGDDTRAQGVTVSFPNVDQSKLYDRLSAGQHRGLRCRMYRVHIDEDTGTTRGEPVVLNDGELYDGIRVVEEAGNG